MNKVFYQVKNGDKCAQNLRCMCGSSGITKHDTF